MNPLQKLSLSMSLSLWRHLGPRRRLVRARVAALSGLQRPLTLIKQIIKTPESLLFYLFVLKITFFCRWRARSPIEFCPPNPPL